MVCDCVNKPTNFESADASLDHAVDDATSKQANILHRRLQVDKYLFGPFQLHALAVRSSIAGQLDIITLLEQQEKLF